MIKKNSFIRASIILLLIMFALSDMQVQCDSQKTVQVFVNDKEIRFDSRPVVLNGDVLVPFIQFIDAFGFYSEWDDYTKTATACSIDKRIELKTSSKTALVNNKEVELSAPPRIINDVVFVPARFLVENLGGVIKYDEENAKLNLYIDLISEHYSKDQKEWALATNAILIKMNGFQMDVLGGRPKTEETVAKEVNSLFDSWDIYDRETALETIEWLKAGGHRTQFNEYILYVSKLNKKQFNQLIAEHKGNKAYVERLDYYYNYLAANNNVTNFTDPGILAWDYCRLVNLAGACYIAGYLSYEEAWNETMNAAKIIQSSYHSWSGMGLSYAEGRNYWGGAEAFFECMRVFDLLCKEDNSPWRRLQWELPLDGKALSLKDTEITIIAGETLTLPTALEAVVDKKDSTRQVGVIWEPYTIDTSAIGSYVIRGVAENYDEEVILIVNVIGGLPGNLNGNIKNDGLAAVHGDWVYYIGSSANQRGLCKIKTDGSEKTVLTGSSCSGLSIMGDWIYYKRGISGIYKIKTDGSGETMVTDDAIRQMNTLDGWIYYQTYSITDSGTYQAGGPIFKIKPDGTNKIKLCERSSQFAISNGWIYYIDSFGSGILMKMRTDGSEKSQVYNNAVFDFNIAGDWIYFTNINAGTKLYKFKIDGSNLTKVFNMQITDINIAGDWIYFVDAEDGLNGGAIYKVKTDGTEQLKLYGETCKDISIVDSWVYFRKVNDYNGYYRMKTDGTCIEKL